MWSDGVTRTGHAVRGLRPPSGEIWNGLLDFGHACSQRINEEWWAKSSQEWRWILSVNLHVRLEVALPYALTPCVTVFLLRVIVVMSTCVFSNLIMKCHQQEQASGKNKLCHNSPHECCNSCSLCVFPCVCVTHELNPLLIKEDCSFYIITDSDVRLQRVLFLSLFAAPVIGLQAHLPQRHFLPFLSFPL